MSAKLSAKMSVKRQTTISKNPSSNNQICSLDLIMIDKELNEVTMRMEQLLQQREEILSKNSEKCSYIC
jgi:hypothetical protein